MFFIFSYSISSFWLFQKHTKNVEWLLEDIIGGCDYVGETK